MNAQQLIDTVQRMEQAMREGQQREMQMRQQLDALLLQQQQQGMQGGPVDVGRAFQELARSQSELLEAMRTSKSGDKKMNLVDNKGLAKPDRFDGQESRFLYWRTRLEAFMTSVYPDLEDILQCAEESDHEITSADVQAAWGATNPIERTIEDIEGIDTQVYAVLQTLVEKEPFTIVRSAGKHRGFDAWRRLVKRYDPSTGNRRRAMLRHIISPNKCTKLEDLSNTIESWEEEVRLYEQRKRPDGTRHVLDEEIKISTLEFLCPNELERHLQLNRSRYTTYHDVRSEITLFLETKLGSRIRIGDASAPSDPNGAQPMDIGGFGKDGKGKKGGKGKGGKGKDGKGKGDQGKGKSSGKGGKSQQKETRTCHNCGKTGHLVKDCWSAGGGQSGKPKAAAKPKSAPKGSKGGKGKGVSNLEQDNAEPEAEAVETGFLSIAGLEHEDNDFVEVIVDNEDYVEVPIVYDERCQDPCSICFCHQCHKKETHRESRHICNICENELEEIEKLPLTKQSARKELKMIPVCEFEMVVDKTLCLFRGMAKKAFDKLSIAEKEKLRQVMDPTNAFRSINDEVMNGVNERKEELRVRYFERLTELLLEASQTIGSGQSSGSKDLPSQTHGLAELPSRPAGTASGTLMHRTIEQMEIANLDAEKRELAQELEEVEDEEEGKVIEAKIAAIDEQKKRMKDKVKEDDKTTREKANKGFQLTEETVTDQSWHDSRYHMALRSGISHSVAWSQEKKRRRATLKRKQGIVDRTRERLDMDRQWHEEFDSKEVKDEEFFDETAGGIETEAVEDTKDGRIRVLGGKAKQIKRGELEKSKEGKFMKSARTYRKLSQDEVAKFRTETKEDELKVMKKRRVNIFAKRRRHMTQDKKEARKKRVKAARKKRDEGAFYLRHPKDEMRCKDFTRSFCNRGAKCTMRHSELDREIGFLDQRHELMMKHKSRVKLVPRADVKEEPAEVNSFSSEPWTVDADGWIRLQANFDTGAAITAIPTELREKLNLQPSDVLKRNYKTASGELLSDEGGVVLKGYSSQGQGRSVEGRLVDVQRMLVSGSAVGKKNCVLLDGKQGYIIPKSGPIANGLKKALEKLMEQYPSDAAKITEMYEHNGIYCFDMWVHEKVKSNKTGDELGAVASSSSFPRQARL